MRPRLTRLGARGVLARRPGSEPASPVLAGGSLTLDRRASAVRVFSLLSRRGSPRFPHPSGSPAPAAGPAVGLGSDALSLALVSERAS